MPNAHSRISLQAIDDLLGQIRDGLDPNFALLCSYWQTKHFYISVVFFFLVVPFFQMNVVFCSAEIAIRLASANDTLSPHDGRTGQDTQCRK